MKTSTTTHSETTASEASASTTTSKPLAHERIDPTLPLPATAWMPPRIVKLLLVLSIAAHFLFPRQPVVFRNIAVAALLAILGLGLMFAAWRVFSKAGTAIRPTQRASAVVTAGPYRISRNPMYLAMVSMLLAVAFLLGSAVAWCAAISLPLILQLRFIRNEERAMEAAMGEAYLRYKSSVRRWL